MSKSSSIFKTLLVASFILSSFSSVSSNASSSARADNDQPRSWFEDTCSNEKTNVYFGKNVRYESQLNGLKPGVRVLLQLRVSPANRNSKASTLSYVWDDVKSANGNGELSISKKIKLPKRSKLQALLPQDREWVAELRWYELTTADRNSTGGTEYAYLYLAKDENERFFRVLSPAICTWETAPKIASEYFYNSDQNWMDLYRQRMNLDAFSREGGVHLGVGPNPNRLGPETIDPSRNNPLSENVMGWFFIGSEKFSSVTESFSSQQRWRLRHRQGGYFFSRSQFMRFPVEKIEYDSDASRCGSWKSKGYGYLDLGAEIEDFITIPRNMIENDQAVRDFAESMRPTFNSCEDSGLSTGESDVYIPSFSENSELFNRFYPNDNARRSIENEN